MEQRRSPRVQPFVAPCRVLLQGGRRLTAYMADLGLDGARILCDVQPPAVGSTVVVEVRLRGRAARSRLDGEVRWIRPRADDPPGHMFGVTFKELTPDAQRAIEAVVEEFRRRAAELA